MRKWELQPLISSGAWQRGHTKHYPSTADPGSNSRGANTQVTNHWSLGANGAGKGAPGSTGQLPWTAEPPQRVCPLHLPLDNTSVYFPSEGREGCVFQMRERSRAPQARSQRCCSPREPQLLGVTSSWGLKGSSAGSAAQHKVGAALLLWATAAAQLSPLHTSLLLCHARVYNSLTHPQRGRRRDTDGTWNYLIHTLAALSQPE